MFIKQKSKIISFGLSSFLSISPFLAIGIENSVQKTLQRSIRNTDLQDAKTKAIKKINKIKIKNTLIEINKGKFAPLKTKLDNAIRAAKRAIRVAKTIVDVQSTLDRQKTLVEKARDTLNNAIYFEEGIKMKAFNRKNKFLGFDTRKSIGYTKTDSNGIYVVNDAYYMASTSNGQITLLKIKDLPQDEEVFNFKVKISHLRTPPSSIIEENIQTYRTLTSDKVKFDEFDQTLIGSNIGNITDGKVNSSTLTNLNGHDKMPPTTQGVTRKFSIKTDRATGVATVTITFTAADKTKLATSYTITGFIKNTQQGQTTLYNEKNEKEKYSLDKLKLSDSIFQMQPAKDTTTIPIRITSGETREEPIYSFRTSLGDRTFKLSLKWIEDKKEGLWKLVARYTGTTITTGGTSKGKTLPDETQGVKGFAIIRFETDDEQLKNKEKTFQVIKTIQMDEFRRKLLEEEVFGEREELPSVVANNTKIRQEIFTRILMLYFESQEVKIRNLFNEKMIKFIPNDTDGTLKIQIDSTSLLEKEKREFTVSGFLTKYQLNSRYIGHVRKMIESIVGMEKNTDKSIPPIRLWTTFNKVVFDNLGTGGTFPKNIKGTTLKYRHNGINKDGALTIEVQIARGSARAKIGKFNIQVSGINKARANADITSIKNLIKSATGIIRTSKDNIEPILSGTIFNKNAWNQLGIRGIFPSDIKGTTLTYSHQKVSADGPFMVTVKIGKIPGVTQTTTLTINAKGINKAKANADILAVKNAIESFRVNKLTSKPIAAISSRTIFNKSVLTNLNNGRDLKFDAKGTTLTYSHPGITSNGILPVTVNIAKKLGTSQTAKFYVEVSGIDQAKASADILAVKNAIESITGMTKTVTNNVPSMTSWRVFNKQSFSSLGSGGTFPSETKSTKLYYRHSGINHDGNLVIQVRIEKKLGTTQIARFNIWVSGINKTKTLKLIDLLQEKDFRSVYTDSDKEKLSSNHSQKNSSKKSQIVQIIKNKIRFKNNHFVDKITNSMIGFESLDGQLKIVIKKRVLSPSSQNKIITIQGFITQAEVDKIEALNIIRLLKPRDFRSVYSRNEKINKFSKDSSLTINAKKTLIIDAIKRKATNEGVRNFFQNSMIGFEKSNGTLTITIDKKSLGNKYKTKKKIIISGFKKLPELNTSDISIQHIEFIGFNKNGRISKDDSIYENPNKGEYTIEFNQDINNLLKNKKIIIEYKVTNSLGNDIKWTDTNNLSKKGWRTSAPISLKNNDELKVRLKSSPDYFIVDSTPSTIDPNYIITYSHEMSIVVSDLKQRISIPSNFKYYDINNLIDGNGKKIKYLRGMPSVEFETINNKWRIKISMDRTFSISQHISHQIQILRPWRPKSIPISNPIVDNWKKPIYGYELKIIDNDENVSWKLVFVTEEGLSKQEKIASKGWGKDIHLTENSWFNYEDVDIKINQAMIFRVIAKHGYGLKWENEKSDWIDNWIPKSYSNKTFNQVNNVVDPLIFKGLIINPPKIASEVSMLYKPVTLSGRKLRRAYQGNAIPTPSLMNGQSDNWVWEFRIKSGSTWKGDWTRTPSHQINNGDEIYLRVATKNSLYILSYDFQQKNREFKFDVSGLPNMIETTFVPRPIIKFGGNVGQGKISDLVEHNPNPKKPFTDYERTNNNLPQPIASHTSRVINTYDGLKWQYQVSRSHPLTMSNEQLKKLAWSNTPPTNLNIGNYVRVRLSPKNNQDSVEPIKYSYSKINGGWTKVTGLSINSGKIEISPKIEGFIGKTKLKVRLTLGTLDEKGAIIQASINNVDWFHLKKITNLRNNQKVSYRVIARKDYKIDDSRQNVHTDSISGIKFIQKPKWKNQPVQGLTSFINVNSIKIKTFIKIRDSRHPNDIEINKNKLLKGFKKTDILNGHSSIANMNGQTNSQIKNWVNNIKSVVDSAKQFAGDKIKIKFIVARFDADSNSYSEEDVYDTVPEGLKNKDKITIRIVPINKNYKLSRQVSSTMIINNLVIKPPDMQPPPKLQFRGENNKGTVIVTPVATKGFRWVYYVSKKVKPQNLKEIIFSSKVPTNLANGDYVIVELRSSITGAKITQTYRTKPQIIMNLKSQIDLSYLILDPSKVLKIKGTISNSAIVIGKTPHKILDLNKNKIQDAKELIWKYAITKSKTKPNDLSKYSSKAPSKLKNGHYVHAMLVSKNPNLQVIGFNPISLKIQNLKNQGKISNKKSLLIILICSIIGVSSIGIAIFSFHKNKKKKML